MNLCESQTIPFTIDFWCNLYGGYWPRMELFPMNPNMRFENLYRKKKKIGIIQK